MILETQTPEKLRTLPRLAAFAAFITLALHGLAPAATFTWTNGITGNWSSTSLTTDWKSTTAPNAPGTAISYTHYPSGSASATVTLDMDATAGTIGHGAGPGGNTGIFTIQRNASSHVLTMDNTGGGTNLFGNTNAAISGSGNANTYDITQVYPDIVISNTDLDIGSSGGGVKIGSSANSNSITATTSQNLNLRWNAGNAGRPMTINASIGTSGAGTITLNHYGTGSPTHTMNLNGTIGSMVGGITQDTTVSILSLNANNSGFVGASISSPESSKPTTPTPSAPAETSRSPVARSATQPPAKARTGRRVSKTATAPSPSIPTGATSRSPPSTPPTPSASPNPEPARSRSPAPTASPDPPRSTPARSALAMARHPPLYRIPMR